MKKFFLSVLIVILTITFALAATDHDAHKLDPNVPFKKAMDKMRSEEHTSELQSH